MVQQFWPFVGEYVKTLLTNTVAPQVEKSLPERLRPFKFTEIDLGDLVSWPRPLTCGLIYFIDLLVAYTTLYCWRFVFEFRFFSGSQHLTVGPNSLFYLCSRLVLVAWRCTRRTWNVTRSLWTWKFCESSSLPSVVCVVNLLLNTLLLTVHWSILKVNV